MDKARLDIFQYADYRMFLKDMYEERKKESKVFSFRGFAQKAGTAPSLLADIIEGRRSLSLEVMEKYATALGMTERERRYFGHMVRFVNARKSREKNEAFGEMSVLRRQTYLRFLDPVQYEFWSQWHHAAVRELVTIEGFQEDPDWIAKHLEPRITPVQARKSLELLLKLGLLVRGDNGKLHPADPAISSEYETPSLVIRHFNQEMISQALTAADRILPADREIGGLTLGLSKECYDRVKQRIRIFKEEILTMVLEDSRASELVAQLNIQLFPLTASANKPEGKA